MFTDGSVDPISRTAGFTVYIPKLGITDGRQLPDWLSVFSAEVVALSWAERAHLELLVVCSNSTAALGALSEGSRFMPDLILELRMALYSLQS